MPRPVVKSRVVTPVKKASSVMPRWLTDPKSVYDKIMHKYTDVPESWAVENEVAKAIEESLDPLPCFSFEDLVAVIKKQGLHWTQRLEDTLICVLAVIVSTGSPGDQLWMRVIGPPGSGKSTLESIVSASRDYVYLLDVFKGIMSGWRSADGKDNSLIPRIRGKCVMISDGDTMMQSSSLEKIMSELRRLYDRSLHGDFLNGIEIHHDNVESTFILCGTDTLRALDKSSLGERFLNCEIFGADTDHEPYIKRSFTNTYNRLRNHLTNEASAEQSIDFTEIKQRCMGLLQYLVEDLFTSRTFQFPECSPETESKIESIAQVLSHVRARCADPEEASYRSRNEVATRLTAQLTKLGVFVAIILGEKDLNGNALRIIRSVAMASGESYHMEILKELASRKEGLDAQQLSNILEISHTSVRRILDEMQTFHIVCRDERSNRSGARGRNRHVWLVTDYMKGLLDIADAA